MYDLKQYPVFKQFLNKLFRLFYIYFLLFNSDTLQECSFVLLFQSFALMDVVIPVFFIMILAILFLFQKLLLIKMIFFLVIFSVLAIVSASNRYYWVYLFYRFFRYDSGPNNAISRGHASCWKGEANFRSKIRDLRSLKLF